VDTAPALPAIPAWRALGSYLRPHWRSLFAGGGLSLVSSASLLALPLVARQLINNLGHGGPLTGPVFLMIALVSLNAAVGAFGGYLLQRTAESVVLTARRGLIARLVRLRVPAVDRSEPGDLMARVTSDTTLLREVTTSTVVNGVTGALTMAATIVLMGLMDVVLLGVTLAALAIAGAVVGLVVPRINRAAKRAQESVGAMGTTLERMFGAVRMVKAAGAEDREGGRADAAAVESYSQFIRAARWGAVAGHAAGLAAQIAFVAVLIVGGIRVASGSITVATLVAFLLYVFYLIGPTGQLVRAVTQYPVGAAAASRIQEAHALPVEDLGAVSGARAGRAPIGSSHSRPGPATVTFDAVRFQYREELPIVHNGLSFDVPAGGMTAFVGPSGAGKTTVFSLIERFYDADDGHVRLDGVDVRDWSLGRLRAAIGYVEQDAPVLSGTLRENLRYGAPDAPEDELREVVRTARLDGLVARLPDGLDTQVGHRGTKLSGGERQRVAIARALLRDPRLLLLDEATSQLDAVNEAALRATITDVAARTTVLVIAHRLSTVTMADRIVVMDAGRVRAIGTHAELVAADDLYAELAATQFLATAT
jgi:ABC-type multidrug transport system fused ATPase/permease subunit